MQVHDILGRVLPPAVRNYGSTRDPSTAAAAAAADADASAPASKRHSRYNRGPRHDFLHSAGS